MARVERKKREKKKKSGRILALIVLVIVVAAGAYALLNYSSDNLGDAGSSESTTASSNKSAEGNGSKSGVQYDEFVVTEDDKYVYNESEGRPMYYQKYDKPANAGWINDKKGEHIYYCEGEGKLATGWKYLEGKVWYFYNGDDANKGYQAGKLARNYETPGKINIPETGYIDGDEGLALAYAMDVLNRKGWNLEAAYRYSGGLRFEKEDELDENTKTHEAALMGFKTGKGNCMVWSGTFCTMAKLLGKDAKLIWGTLTWNGIRPHAWVEITEGDGEDPHVYDPRKNDGQDMAGFDVHYGDGGTYDYNLDSRVYLEW